MISKFLEITRKDERTILGLMSGTSADGLDVALVKLKGGGTDIDLKLITARTYEYDDEFKRKIIELYDPESSRVNDICEMNFLIAKKHAEFVLQFLKENNLNSEDVDCIAYHGQTIHHLPNGGKYGVRSTMQIGEMDLLAYMTGIMTVGDFRKKDLSAGGQGAPLVSYMDYILYRNEEKSISVHNLGGISNLTYLPRGCSKEDVIAFDTGPANALIDAVVKHYFDMNYDEDGKISSRGDVVKELFYNLVKIDDGYFKKEPPKTTGKEVYNLNFVMKALENLKRELKPEDILKTVVHFTAWHIFQNYSIHIIPKGLDEIVFSGGGTKNETLMNLMRTFFKTVNVKVRVDNRFGKFKEAVCMAMLAHEFLNGSPNNIPSATGAREPVICGKLSFPR